MNDALKVFCEDIIACLIKYGALEETAARELVQSSQICIVTSEMEIDLLFHETPYYWAMTILHSNDPQWHQNPKLWPPPQEYLDNLYRIK